MRHFAALPHGEVAAAIKTIRESTAQRSTILAFEFLVLTAARSGEVRLATWDEVDGAIWTVPGSRTKTGREHRVPLSTRALGVLAEAREISGDKGLIFPVRATSRYRTRRSANCSGARSLRCRMGSAVPSEIGAERRASLARSPRRVWHT